MQGHILSYGYDVMAHHFSLRNRAFGIKSIAVAALSGLLPGMAVAIVTPAPPALSAKGYILMDYTTGAILAESNSEMSLAPASLTKIMTSYVIGQEMKEGRLAENEIITVGKAAWSRNFPDSSKMFIEPGDKIRVSDVNRGIIIQSGNDATVAMAEHIAGSEQAFVDLMNGWGQRIGLKNTRFSNAHGLDATDKYTTPYDMALLSQALIRDVPEEYAIYKEQSFTWNGITQYNRNPLLRDKSMDVDGIKTGYTSNAGYSLVTSATRDGMRLISVVMGTANERARAEESRKLLSYGFRFFETDTLMQANEAVITGKVWMGTEDDVAAGSLVDVSATLPRGQTKKLKAEYQLNSTLKAPIEKGDEIGVANWVADNGEIVVTEPLLALNAIEEGGFFQKVLDWFGLKLSQLLSGLF